LLRFAAVGLASAGIYFGLLWLFTAVTRFSLSIRAALAYGIGIIFNYLTQRSFTFRSARQHQHAGPRYMVVQVGGLVINSAALWLGVDVEHWWYPLVQFGAIALTAIWSYLGQKFWAFEHSRGQG
jgi:putative flippase GtrA